MLLFFLLPLPAFLQVVAALQTNITLDDVSPMIKYSGKWEPSSSHMSGLDFGGSHTFSSDSSASATFTFTGALRSPLPAYLSSNIFFLAPGVAIYYLSPRWPYAVSTRLTLDGGSSTLVNLTDPATSPSPPGGSESALTSVVWSATGLANASHTLVATIGNYIIMDGLIYTTDNGLPVSSSSAASSSFAASSSSSTTRSSSSSTTLSSSQSVSATMSASSAGASVIPSRSALTIGLATAFSLTVFFAAMFLAFALYQRRRFRRARSARPTVLDDWGSTERGRGGYAAVSTGGGHGVEMSNASSGLISAYAPSSGLSNPWEPGDSHHAQAPSNASSSVSSYLGLPPGAGAPVVPGPYTDRAPLTPEPHETTFSPSEVLSRAASSHIRFAPLAGDAESIGSGNDVQISSPPAYSERCPSSAAVVRSDA
ncbi:hypothetical protein C8F04DRAFT_97215 [Mycena alexandri]|uniref:Transmembrane protein n=1 Tax=Mycena alexandri TaxID=1745969 RepID=A0AAD6TC16_9AGAR|nr:hypothetical protein C8F04DRAFT_97215 [Mycena alexandri]